MEKTGPAEQIVGASVAEAENEKALQSNLNLIYKLHSSIPCIYQAPKTHSSTPKPTKQDHHHDCLSR